VQFFKAKKSNYFLNFFFERFLKLTNIVEKINIFILND